MAKSQQTFNKGEREKKRRKKKKEKEERREQRKLEKEERGKLTFEDQLSYVDENGNITSEKPDPTKKIIIKAEDIKLGGPRERVSMEVIRNGRVKFFNEEKGYGFITDKETREGIFVHINNAYPSIKENHKVTFEIEQGPKGPTAVNVAPTVQK
jgi:cold shock CspA family protein